MGYGELGGDQNTINLIVSNYFASERIWPRSNSPIAPQRCDEPGLAPQKRILKTNTGNRREARHVEINRLVKSIFVFDRSPPKNVLGLRQIRVPQC